MPLDNPKEELLAQTFVKDPETRFNQTKTYLKVIPTVTPGSAEVLGAREFGKVSIKNRVLELIAQDESLNENGQKECLKDLILNGRDGVRLGVVQTLWKAQGILADGNSLQQNNIANVNFNLVTVNNNLPAESRKSVPTTSNSGVS